MDQHPPLTSLFQLLTHQWVVLYVWVTWFYTEIVPSVPLQPIGRWNFLDTIWPKEASNHLVSGKISQNKFTWTCQTLQRHTKTEPNMGLWIGQKLRGFLIWTSTSQDSTTHQKLWFSNLQNNPTVWQGECLLHWLCYYTVTNRRKIVSLTLKYCSLHQVNWLNKCSLTLKMVCTSPCRNMDDKSHILHSDQDFDRKASSWH